MPYTSYFISHAPYPDLITHAPYPDLIPHNSCRIPGPHTSYLITHAPYPDLMLHIYHMPHSQSSFLIPNNSCPISYLMSHTQTSFPVSHQSVLHLVSLQIAFKYLGCILFPLFICYGIYSLIYVEHKGWYSFLLSMSYGFLLTFGESSSHALRGWLLAS